MWHLKIDSQKAKKYKDKLVDFYEKSFNRDGHKKIRGSEDISFEDQTSTKAYNFLTKTQVDEYLDATPAKMIELHNTLFHTILGEDSNQEDWIDVINNLDKKRTEDKPLLTELLVIKKVFNYESYIDAKTDFSYWLAELIGTNTCVYCNRQYTLTIRESNTQEGLVRPTFDHWLPQKYYPDLALSFYNLIPSCSLCNSSLKHDDAILPGQYIYPYGSKGAGFDFTYRELAKHKYMVDTNITTTDNEEREKVKRTMSMFHIKDIYNAHADFELKDLMNLSQQYPGDYVDTLISNVMKDLNVSRSDVYRLIFGVESNPDKYLDRPMSKFKMDIIGEIRKSLSKK